MGVVGVVGVVGQSIGCEVPSQPVTECSSHAACSAQGVREQERGGNWWEKSEPGKGKRESKTMGEHARDNMWRLWDCRHVTDAPCVLQTAHPASWTQTCTHGLQLQDHQDRQCICIMQAVAHQKIMRSSRSINEPRCCACLVPLICTMQCLSLS